jgi:hypothetical protein
MQEKSKCTDMSRDEEREDGFRYLSQILHLFMIMVRPAERGLPTYAGAYILRMEMFTLSSLGVSTLLLHAHED